MAIVQDTYTGNGSTTIYSLSFPYLQQSDVVVTLNGTITTAYTFATSNTIQFTTAPGNGVAIKITRNTELEEADATFYPGSTIRAQDLNDNFTQLLYVAQEADYNVDTANATSATALTNSNTAISTANTASTNASNAVTTANAASANASAAVSTANTASTNASAAVSTANTASTTATTALNTANSATTTANSATSTANTALSTANTALTNANAAVSTANTASTNASNAVSTANTASTNATNAVNTANTASTNASNAVTTANAADTKANQAIAAVASAILYTVVANVAAIPGSPANNTAIEVTDSSGIQSFTPLAGIPGGFTGNSGLSVRIVYSTAGATWNWIQYFPNDPENRYLKLSGGTLTGALTLSADPVSSLQPATKQYVDTADGTKLSLTGGTMTGAIAMSTNKITGLGDPTAAQEAATKNYVDTQISGISTSSIQQGNTSISVNDGGVGSANIVVDGTNAGIFSASGINFYQALFQQNSLNLTDQNKISFWEATANGLNSVGFKGPANIAADVTWTLPAADGSANQALTTNGSSTLSWVSFLPSSGGTVTGDVLLDNQSDLRFGEATGHGGNYVAFQAPSTIAANVTWTLPNADATVAGHALKSDAAGNLSWGTAGGAAGAGGDDVFYENGQTVTTNYTITAGKNAMSAGPITINSGATVTVGSGQSWVIV